MSGVKNRRVHIGRRRLSLRRWVPYALLLVGCVQGFREFRAVAAVERALKGSNNLKVDPATPRESVAAKADELRQALRARWDDAEGQQQLAHLLMQQYRLQIYRQLAEQYPEPELELQLWLLASPKLPLTPT